MLIGDRRVFNVEHVDFRQNEKELLSPIPQVLHGHDQTIQAASDLPILLRDQVHACPNTLAEVGECLAACSL
jgi:hypothetical protein